MLYRIYFSMSVCWTQKLEHVAQRLQFDAFCWGAYIILELAGRETKLFYLLMIAVEDLGKSAVYSYGFFCSFVWKRVCTVIDYKV
jgi:hypothetical protein